MINNTKIALFSAVILWASAFVGIREGLSSYSPEGLALLRFIVASLCMSIVYFNLPNRAAIAGKDKLLLLLLGCVGIGIYNITLNYGEIAVSSGISSFIISQSPILTALFACLFLGEKLNAKQILGFMISVFGVAVIAYSQKHNLQWQAGLKFILIATLVSSIYSILQKPFLKKYHAIQVTAFIIWGGTLFLLFYAPKLQHDLMHATIKATLTIIYLGIFPAAIGYLAWSYVLAKMEAAQAVSFLYFMPFAATLIGWFCLNEAPVFQALLGGLIAIMGVVLVQYSHPKTIAQKS